MSSDPHHHHSPDSIELPTPTAWPIIAAFGLSLMMLGLVTNFIISGIGFLVAVIGATGWFSDVFPHPKHEPVPVAPEEKRPKAIRTHGRVVEMLQVGEGEVMPNRAHVPTEIHPYRVGAWAGLVAGAVMAILALGFGIFKYGSIWYPVNVLAAVGVPSLGQATLAQLHEFSLAGLIVGLLTHVSTSVLVGLLYAIMVPMLPRKREWIWGGIVIPLIWTGLLYATMRMISPIVAAGMDWPWFIVCQIAFGFVCGYIVFRSGKVHTMQSWSLAAKLGVEAQHRDEEKP